MNLLKRLLQFFKRKPSLQLASLLKITNQLAALTEITARIVVHPVRPDPHPITWISSEPRRLNLVSFTDRRGITSLINTKQITRVFLSDETNATVIELSSGAQLSISKSLDEVLKELDETQES